MAQSLAFVRRRRAHVPRPAFAPPTPVATHNWYLRGLVTALGEPAYAAAWAEGQTLSLDEAIRQALEDTEPSADLVNPAMQPSTAAGPTPPPALARHVREPAAADTPVALTPRQREIAALVAQGCTNRQIGEALVITEGTARVHVEHILSRLNLHSRAQLAAWAAMHVLLPPGTGARRDPVGRA